MIFFFLISLVILAIGMYMMVSKKEHVTVMINGVILPGKHTASSSGNVSIENKNLPWLSKQTTDEMVTTKDLKNYFKVVKENWNQETHTYQAILLPKNFQYITEETADGQSFAEAKVYPKGVMVHVKEYRIDFTVLEMTPKEDFETGTDMDGFKYEYNQKEWLEGLPLPSPLNVEIVDYPNGHKEMENVEHFSVRLNY